MEENGSKISLPEFLIVGAFIATADIVEFILIWIGLDDFFISDLIAFPATQIYLRIKGVKGKWSLIMNLIEIIPYGGWIPWRSFGFAMTTWIDHHPEQLKPLSKMASIKR